MTIGHVFACFAIQVLRHPEHTAIHDLATGSRLSYHDLHERVTSLALLLSQRGCQPGEIVGVCLPRSPEAIIAWLAILQLGAAYLPLDPGEEPPRVRFWLTQAHSPLVITQLSSRSTVASFPDDHVVCLDQLDWSEVPPVVSGFDEPHTGTGETLACVLKTAGTTGPAKGVCLSHRSLLYQAIGSPMIRVGPTERVAQVMPLSSYPSPWEVWAILLAGATLAMFPQEALQSP